MAKKEFLRGMRGVRTLSGINTVNNVPHRVHMRISALEMEKLRYQQEKAKAMQRIQAIEQRVQEIDIEVVELLAAISLSEGEIKNEPAAANTQTPLPPKATAKSLFPRTTHRVVIKY